MSSRTEGVDFGRISRLNRFLLGKPLESDEEIVAALESDEIGVGLFFLNEVRKTIESSVTVFGSVLSKFMKEYVARGGKISDLGRAPFDFSILREDELSNFLIAVQNLKNTFINLEEQRPESSEAKYTDTITALTEIEEAAIEHMSIVRESDLAEAEVDESVTTVEAKESLPEQYHFATLYIVHVRNKAKFKGFFKFSSLPEEEQPIIRPDDVATSQQNLERFLAKVHRGEYLEEVLLELFDQINMANLLLMQLKLDDKSNPGSAVGMPQGSWTVNDEFADIPGDPKSNPKKGYKGIIDRMPIELQPYFKFMKTKVIGMGWTHSMAADLSALDKGGKTSASEILKFFGGKDADASFSAYNLSAVLSRQVDLAPKQISPESLRKHAWDLGPLTRLAMSIYEAAATGGTEEEGIEITKGIPLAKNKNAPLMNEQITRVVAIKYLKWLKSTGRIDASVTSFDEDDAYKPYKNLVEIAVRQAFIQQRISLREFYYDISAMIHELSQWFNARQYYKPTGAKSAFTSTTGKDVAPEAGVLIQKYAVPLGEYLHGFCAVPRDAFIQEDGYEYGSWEKFFSEINAKYGDDKKSRDEYLQSIGMFSAHQMYGSGNRAQFREMEKHFVLLKVKPEYRIMQDDTDIPFVVVNRNAIQEIAGTDLVSLHVDLDTMLYKLRLDEYNPSTGEPMIFLDTIIKDAEKMYREWMELCGKWHKLAEIDEDEPLTPIHKIRGAQALRREGEYGSRVRMDLNNWFVSVAGGLEVIPFLSLIYGKVLNSTRISSMQKSNHDFKNEARRVFEYMYRQFAVPQTHLGPHVLEEWGVRDFYEKGCHYFVSGVFQGISGSSIVSDSEGHLIHQVAGKNSQVRDATLLRKHFREAGDKIRGTNYGLLLPPLLAYWIDKWENNVGPGSNKDVDKMAELGIKIEMMLNAFELELNRYALQELPSKSSMADFRYLQIETASDEVEPMDILQIRLYEALVVDFVNRAIADTLYAGDSELRAGTDWDVAKDHPLVREMKAMYTDEVLKHRIMVAMKRLGIIESFESTVYIRQHYEALRNGKTIDEFLKQEDKKRKKDD